MTMKTNIMIGDILYNVYIEFIPDKEGSIGLCDNETDSITISENLSAVRRHRVLAHEIMHALLTESGASAFLDDEELEEKLVTILESTFYNFLLMNTSIFKGGE